MTMPGWLWIDDTEVLNDSRLLVNLPCAIGEVLINVADDPCPVLMLDPDTGSALAEGETSNPWYSSAYPQSLDFLGFWVTECSLDSTIEREASPRGIAKGGSNLGRVKRRHREIAYEVALVATSDAGLRWGFDWLAQQLDPEEICGQSTALIRLWCADVGDYTDGLYELREVGVLDSPAWGDNPLQRSGCLIRTMTFTLAAGDPWRYSTVEDTEVDRENMELNDDCAGSGATSQSTQHDFLCPARLPNQRITLNVDGPGPIGQRDVNVLIDGTDEGAAAMFLRSRDAPASVVSPGEIEGTQVHYEDHTSVTGVQTTATVTPTSDTRIFITITVTGSGAVPTAASIAASLSAFGLDWELLAVLNASTTATRGIYVFVGQGTVTPGPITYDLGAGTWSTGVLVTEYTNVDFTTGSPFDGIRQRRVINTSANAEEMGIYGNPVVDDTHKLLAFFSAGRSARTFSLGGTAPYPTSSDMADWELIANQPATNIIISLAQALSSAGTPDSAAAVSWTGGGTNTASPTALMIELCPEPQPEGTTWAGAYQNSGPLVVSSGAATVEWPYMSKLGYFTNFEIVTGFLVVESRADEPVDTTGLLADGWLPVENSPGTAGTGVPSTRQTVLWKRQTMLLEPDVVVPDVGTGMRAMIFTAAHLDPDNPIESATASAVIGSAALLIDGTATTGEALGIWVACASTNVTFSTEANLTAEALYERFDQGSGSSGGGAIGVWSGYVPNAGDTGDLNAIMSASGNEAGLAMALRGITVSPATIDYTTEVVTCRLHTGERLLIDSSRRLTLFDEGDGIWRDGSAKVRSEAGVDRYIAIRDSDTREVTVEPANLLGHTDLALITISTIVKVGV